MCSLGEGPRFGHTIFVQLGRRAGGAGITIVIDTLLGEGLVLEGAGITIVINTLHCIKHFWVHCVGSAWKLNVQLGRRAEVWVPCICAAWAKGWRGWYYYSNKHFALH